LEVEARARPFEVEAFLDFEVALALLRPFDLDEVLFPLSVFTRKIYYFKLNGFLMFGIMSASAPLFLGNVFYSSWRLNEHFCWQQNDDGAL
jgi:hypothetical protein